MGIGRFPCRRPSKGPGLFPESPRNVLSPRESTFLGSRALHVHQRTAHRAVGLLFEMGTPQSASLPAPLIGEPGSHGYRGTRQGPRLWRGVKPTPAAQRRRRGETVGEGQRQRAGRWASIDSHAAGPQKAQDSFRRVREVYFLPEKVHFSGGVLRTYTKGRPTARWDRSPEYAP